MIFIARAQDCKRIEIVYCTAISRTNSLLIFTRPQCSEPLSSRRETTVNPIYLPPFLAPATYRDLHRGKESFHVLNVGNSRRVLG